MYDFLKELVTYTHSLGFFEVVKVTGSTTSTTLNAFADKTVVLNSVFKNPVPAIDGTFGVSDLPRLNTILNIPEYKKSAHITLLTESRNGSEVPATLFFSNATGDFTNHYRLMSKELVEAQLPNRTKNPIKWDISLEPSAQSIQRLKFQSQAAGSKEEFCVTYLKGNKLMVAIGDEANRTYNGEFEFATVPEGTTLRTRKAWPLAKIQGVLNLPGNKTIEICDAGAMQITVSTEVAEHQYMILASL